MTPQEVLSKYWGYDSFRPMQQEIVESVLSGHDTLGLLPTGGGKSITFQVPAMLLPGLTVVITPLVSLMKDQVDNLEARNIRAAMLYSGMSLRERNLAYDKARLGKIKLLYVSPERLRGETFQANLRSWDVSLFVVDEAHCISQWGYDFRPSYLRIASIRKLKPDAPVLALTASATPEVRRDIVERLEFRPGHREFRLSFHRKNLSYVIRHDREKEGKLIDALNSVTGSAIVYVRSRQATARYAEALNAAGISATFYHAGLDPSLKEMRQQDWKDNKVRVMVATNAFGMGIDKPDVRVVVHLDIPPSLEEYYQEAGRAGRDGLKAYALMIVSPSDKATLTRRLNAAFPPKEYIADVYEKACVFMGVAVGEGFQRVYEFDSAKFSKTFGLDPDKVKGSLAILTNAGYLDYCEDPAMRARIQILITRNEFYSLTLDKKESDVINAIFRLYPGIFADYVSIDEEVIAVTASMTREEVYAVLLKLKRERVLDYVPKRLVPYIYLPSAREHTRHIQIGRAVYEDRKALMEQRIEAVKTFAFATDRCRDTILLNYFGETEAGPCGMCDVCVSHREKDRLSALTAEERKAERRKLVDHIAECVHRYGRVSLDRLMSAFPDSRQEVIEALQHLIDEKKIVRRGNELTPNPRTVK